MSSPPSGEDAIRRRRADADERTSIFLSVAVGEPTAPTERNKRGRQHILAGLAPLQTS
jgi:hypothetical protein